MRILRLLCVLAAMTAVTVTAGCGASVPAAGTSQPRPPSALAGTNDPKAPEWAREDAAFYAIAARALEEAAVSAIATGTAAKEGSMAVRLPSSLARLSRHGTVRYSAGSEGTPDLVYFDNGDSDFPVADGLIYSSSPTAPPVFDPDGREPDYSVLSTPTPVAPHWWAAAWDPFLCDAVGYDGRDYSDVGVQKAMAADPHALPGPTTTLRGKVIGGVTYENESFIDVNFVATGESKPTPVLTNPHTKRVRARPGGVGTYVVRRTILPNGRELSFALEAPE